MAIDHAATNNAEIARFVAGTYTSLVQWTQAFTNGDQFTITIENQVLYVYDKTLTQVKSYDDSGGGGPTTGNVGISFSSIETSALLDNWSGGTFSTAAGGPSAGTDTATAGLSESLNTVSVTLSIQESG